MKMKHQKILMESAKLIGRIPAVNMSGATATAAAYVSAYRDYSEACRLLGAIATNIELIEGLEKTIRQYQNEEDYDIDGLKESAAYYSKIMNKAYTELKEYISERADQNWS